MPKCPCCEGSGKQEVTCTVFGQPDHPENGTIEMDCIWCEGTGKMSHEELKSYEYAKNMWCECEAGKSPDKEIRQR